MSINIEKAGKCQMMWKNGGKLGGRIYLNVFIQDYLQKRKFFDNLILICIRDFSIIFLRNTRRIVWFGCRKPY